MPQTQPTQNILNFGGLVTNSTPDKIPDRNASQVANIDFSLSGMIQSVRGYSLYGNKIVEAGNCVDSFLYKKNFGTLQDIKLRTRDNGSSIKLEWFNPNNHVESTDGQWELLVSGLTSNTKLGFASANGDGSSKVNKIVMGNAVDNMMVWNGATGTVNTVTSNTIVLNEVLQGEGFTTTGKLIANGIEYTYTGVSSKTFTGVTPDPTGLLADTGVAQKVDVDILTEHLLSVQSTIAFVHNKPSSNDTITDYNNGFVTAGFTAGQKIAITGSSKPTNNDVYTIKTVTAGTITLADDEAIVANVAGDLITIASGCPKGNILLTSQRKLFLSGVLSNRSKVYYSQSGQVTSFGITSGLGSGGSFDLMEGGGPITCMEAKGKNKVVIHKRDAVISYTRDNDGTYAIESFETLADGFDNGATNFKARTALNKTSFFMSGIEGAKSMEAALYTDSLMIAAITDIIMPTIQDYDNSTAVATYFPPKRLLLIATNDKHGDRKQISIYVKGSAPNYIYDISIDDIPVADYIIDGKDIFFVSSLDQNCYRLFGRNSANGNVLNHSYVTKEYTFDSPAQQKEFNIIYCEGLINENSKIRISVEYGIFGQDGSKSFEIRWDNKEIVSSQTVSAIGVDVLGDSSLGGNQSDVMDSYIFSFPLHVDVKPNTRYRVKFETVYDDDSLIDHETYWSIINCAADTKLLDISKLNMQNSNETSGNGIGSNNTGYAIA